MVSAGRSASLELHLNQSDGEIPSNLEVERRSYCQSCQRQDDQNLRKNTYVLPHDSLPDRSGIGGVELRRRLGRASEGCCQEVQRSIEARYSTSVFISFVMPLVAPRIGSRHGRSRAVPLLIRFVRRLPNAEPLAVMWGGGDGRSAC